MDDVKIILGLLAAVVLLFGGLGVTSMITAHSLQLACIEAGKQVIHGSCVEVPK